MDAADLAEMRLCLFQEIQAEGLAHPAEFVSECSQAYVEFFGRDSGRVWVAEDDTDTVVSTLTLLEIPRLPTPASSGRREGYISGVYTRPTWRRRGLATQLLRAAIDHARTAGFARVRLHATDAGRTLYANLGFKDRVGSMEFRL